ncbi:MAG TPA: hypothetical protein VN852_05065 [Candidatus Krumholzibacteria bacterium]|jgi:uncharacterized membrane protein YphA (DoxX/SURF4 family)|nr:hypothetical protein [Candidatus Krumholzibacteria bacterium]
MAGKTSAATTAGNPAFDAYRLLRIGFVVAPLVMGLDKFFNLLTQWPKFVCPLIASRIDPQLFMRCAGPVEIVAGILVLLKPRFGALIVAAWLLLVIVNLLLIPGYYDIVLRDVGLLLAALALARLSAVFSK